VRGHTLLLALRVKPGQLGNCCTGYAAVKNGMTA